MDKRRNRVAILVSDTKNTKKRLLQETYFFMVGSYSTIQKKLTQNESELNVSPRTI